VSDLTPDDDRQIRALNVTGSGAPLLVLVEGRPGSGKTTAVTRLVELLRQEGVAISGFLTREVRERGRRVGFALETLDGRRGQLAHVGVRGDQRLGRYGVVHDDLERLAIPALRAPADVVIVDELGKMELGCAAFRDAVTALLERPVAVVATVHKRPDSFTDELKHRPHVTVVRLTQSNRDDVPSMIAHALGSRDE
jgi:nucleoside-triphosphatase